MTNRFRIKNFKKVQEEIQMEDLSQVNFFVGKNGSGKSSVLNAMSYLNDGSNSKHFFVKDSIVEFQIENKKQFIIWDDKDPNHTSHRGNLNLKIIVAEEEISEKGANGVLKLKFRFDNIGKEQLEFINETSSIIGLSQIKAERIINNDDPWDNSVGTRVFKENEKILNLHFLAQGLKAFNNIRFVIGQSLNFIKEEEKRTLDRIIIILEEPENNLHPDLQKKIPLFFDRLVSSVEKILQEKMIFLVSTHSPFVISAAAQFPKQKVYLLGDGHLLDLEQNRVNISSGFKGSECAWVVGQMLGSEITDLGYPENYCILEEYSMQIILEKAKSLNLIKNIQFVSASGALRVASFSETINQIENLNTLIKCNPYYFDKYMLIIDSLENFSPKEIERLAKIKSRLGDRFIELKETSLEEYYKNLSEEIYKESVNELAKVKGKEKGISKAKYATLIAEQLTSKEDFSRLFKGELDFFIY